jgi:hypothetical protein
MRQAVDGRMETVEVPDSLDPAQAAREPGQLMKGLRKPGMQVQISAASIQTLEESRGRPH